MPPAAPVTMATLLDGVFITALLQLRRHHWRVDGYSLVLPLIRIIPHTPASLFEGANNGSLRCHARFRPHRGAAQLHSRGRGSRPAPLLGDRRRQRLGGAAGSSVAAANDPPGKSDSGW